MDRSRLGERIKSRRVVLGLSMSRAAQEAGISRPTWAAVESGTRETESYNHGPIERVLGWEPGSVDATLAGGEPTLSDRATSAYRGNADRVILAIQEVLKSKISDYLKVRTIAGIIAEDYRPGPPSVRGERGNVGPEFTLESERHVAG